MNNLCNRINDEPKQTDLNLIIYLKFYCNNWKYHNIQSLININRNYFSITYSGHSYYGPIQWHNIILHNIFLFKILFLNPSFKIICMKKFTFQFHHHLKIILTNKKKKHAAKWATKNNYIINLHNRWRDNTVAFLYTVYSILFNILKILLNLNNKSIFRFGILSKYF